MGVQISKTAAYLSATALAVALGLCACASTSHKPGESDRGLSSADGAADPGPADPGPVQRDDSMPDASGPGAASPPPAAAGFAGSTAFPDDPPLNRGDAIVDPGPLRCVAPDREQYKAEHGGDADDGSDDAGFSDDPFDLGNAGMEHTALIVFDRSGSMGGYWDGRSKWQVANDTMVETVSRFQDYLSVGALFFPTDGGCGVAPIESDEQIDFRAGGDFLADWEASMDRYLAGGSTPMSAAFQRADQAIARACQSGLLKRPFKVIVLTDGEPNCNSDLGLLTSLPAKWLQSGIKTYVVGLPGSDPARELLESMARAGGTEAFFSPSEPGEFGDTMHTLLASSAPSRTCPSGGPQAGVALHSVSSSRNAEG